MSRACCTDSGLCVIGTMRPCSFIDGATPAVMKRSDAFLCTISLRKEVKSKSLMAWLLPERATGNRERGTCGTRSGCRPGFDQVPEWSDRLRGTVRGAFAVPRSPFPASFEDVLVL